SGAASTGDITTYAWDLSGTGTGSFTALGQSVSYPTPNFGTFTIRLQVSGPGGTSIDTTTVNVANVAPVAAIAGPAVALRGQSQTFTLTANDPSPADQAAGFTFTINWGDGSP